MTPEQWEAILRHVTRFHHPEVIIIGILGLIFGIFALWLLHRDFQSIIELMRLR